MAEDWMDRVYMCKVGEGYRLELKRDDGRMVPMVLGPQVAAAAGIVQSRIRQMCIAGAAGPFPGAVLVADTWFIPEDEARAWLDLPRDARGRRIFGKIGRPKKAPEVTEICNGCGQRFPRAELAEDLQAHWYCGDCLTFGHWSAPEVTESDGE